MAGSQPSCRPSPRALPDSGMASSDPAGREQVVPFPFSPSLLLSGLMEKQSHCLPSFSPHSAFTKIRVPSLLPGQTHLQCHTDFGLPVMWKVVPAPFPFRPREAEKGLGGGLAWEAGKARGEGGYILREKQR